MDCDAGAGREGREHVGEICHLAVVHGNNDVADLYQAISFGSSAANDSLYIHITI